MKKIIFGLILLMFCLKPFLTFSQNEWAPIGAKWFFTKPLLSYPDVSYTSFESIGDTIINSILCKIIQEFAPISSMGIYDTLRIKHFMYENSNSVYYFEDNQFYLLYNLNKVAGEYWVLNQMNDTVYVDSTDVTLVNGHFLKVLYFHNTDYWNFFRGKIIEKIGWTGYFKPYSLEYSPPVGGNLRCYTDDSLTYLLQTPCDEVATGIENHKSANANLDYVVIQNPFYGNYIYILSSNVGINEVLQIDVYNILGDKMRVNNKLLNNCFAIEFYNVQKGVYFIVIETSRGRFFKKVIRN